MDEDEEISFTINTSEEINEEFELEMRTLKEIDFLNIITIKEWMSFTKEKESVLDRYKIIYSNLHSHLSNLKKKLENIKFCGMQDNQLDLNIKKLEIYLEKKDFKEKLEKELKSTDVISKRSKI